MDLDQNNLVAHWIYIYWDRW